MCTVFLITDIIWGKRIMCIFKQNFSNRAKVMIKFNTYFLWISNFHIVDIGEYFGDSFIGTSAFEITNRV